MAAFLKKNLYYLFDLVGGILFAAVMAGVVVHNFKLDSITPVLTLGFAVAFVLLQRLIDRLPSKGPVYWGMIAGVFLVMLVWHIAAACLLELDINAGDARVTMTSAMYLVAGENIPIDTYKSYNYPYFAQYQNQFGYLILLTAVAKLGMLLTGHVSFVQFAIFNLIVIEASVLMAVILTEHIGKKLGIASCGLRIMVILALAPFLWMMVPYAYTDSLSLPFIMGVIMAGLYGMEHIQPQKGVLLFNKKGYADVICFLVVGALIAVGYWLKGNIVILFIALEIILFAKTSLKKWCELSVAMVTAFAITSLTLSLIISGTGLLTKENSNRYKFPITHWIMMGMDRFGASGEDVAYTASFTSYEEKKVAVAQRMKEKFKKLGIEGLLNHYYKKATRDGWDSGMFSMDSMLNLPSGSIVPKRRNELHEYITRTGAHHAVFRPWAHAYWNALELLALIGFFSIGKRKGEPLVMIRLFITGMVLFFMVWEANWRYIFGATLPVSILAAFEMEALSLINLHNRKKQSHTGIAECLLRDMTQSMDEIINDQMEQRLYADAEKVVSVYQRVGEAITYGSTQQRAVSAKAGEMRRTLSEKKSRQRVVDNAIFYLDLWKNPDDIAQSQLANVIESGLKLRSKLEALDGAQTDEDAAGLIRELDMRIQYMKSRLPEDEPNATVE